MTNLPPGHPVHGIVVEVPDLVDSALAISGAVRLKVSLGWPTEMIVGNLINVLRGNPW